MSMTQRTLVDYQAGRTTRASQKDQGHVDFPDGFLYVYLTVESFCFIRCSMPKTGDSLTEGNSDMEKPVAQPITLIDLAEYQEGSVVSRTIIDKKTSTVTFFAFDEGQGLSEHTSPFDALVFLIDGEAEITIAGTTLRLKEGQMVIMPANKPHALKAVKKFKMVLTMIRS